MATEEEVDRRAQARISRQEILHRENPPKVWAVLDEGALRRVIGGPEVMKAQLRHLIDMCDHPAVTLQILPFSAGAHRAMGGPFTILRYTEPDLRDVVYIEQLTSALYLDKPTEVDAYLEVIEEVCLQAEPSAKTPGILTLGAGRAGVAIPVDEKPGPRICVSGAGLFALPVRLLVGHQGRGAPGEGLLLEVGRLDEPA